jgi:hypothetical protein
MPTSIKLTRIYTPVNNAYDKPPLPDAGEDDEAPLFEAIGRATTAWENFERSLMLVYTALLSPALYYLPIERAYGSVMSFSGRKEMVQAAAEALFYKFPDPVAEKDLAKLIDLAGKFSGRRNEIAHGIVKPYNSPSGPQLGVLLLPSDYAKNKHGLRDDVDPQIQYGARFIKPTYAYGCPEIMHFEECFRGLAKEADRLSISLGRVFAPTS